MRLTRAAEYAIRCILYLAKKGPGELASRKDIAEHAEIPPPFLAKIAQDLARAGLIEIRQGARGGFMSCRKIPKDITLLEVVETMIGEIYLNDCVARPSSCNALEDGQLGTGTICPDRHVSLALCAADPGALLDTRLLSHHLCANRGRRVESD
jgi:Rrf2 family protein